MNYCVSMTEDEFDKAIIDLAKDIVLSAEFADRNTEGHQTRGEIAQSMADLQTDLDNRETLKIHNPDYEMPTEERAIFENGEGALDTACEQWGIDNPLDEYGDDKE